jgi:hypothetical protein
MGGTDVIMYLVAGATVLVLGAMFWTHVQQQAAIDRLDDRVAHLMAGVSLLTDTTEGALRDVAVEIGRLAATTESSRPQTPAASRSRINGAARRGRTVQDIAANEQLSEGEVRLHLQLDKARKDRTRHASLR